jgi:uncharacterized protein (DUF169 family)
MVDRTNCWGDDTDYDYGAIVMQLQHYLKLQTIPVGMKRFATLADAEKVEKLRRPPEGVKLATDQVVGQSRWMGYTIGITAENLVGAQCSAVVGLTPRDEAFLDGSRFEGVWYGTLEDSEKHQAAMACASYGEYEALVVSPLASGRLGNPDICLVYATPGQMITLINGLQYRNYEPCAFTVVGESACADSWGRALQDGKPAVSIPCYAERKFGGVQDNELLIAFAPNYLRQIVEGLAELSRNGLRYPIPSIGLETSPVVALAQSYGPRGT